MTVAVLGSALVEPLDREGFVVAMGVGEGLRAEAILRSWLDMTSAPAASTEEAA